MFNKKRYAGLRLFFATILLFYFLSGMDFYFFADSDLKKIRVGLIEPGASLASCTISFEGAHGVYLPKDPYTYSFQKPIFTVNEAATYTLKRMVGTCEISKETMSSIDDFDLTKYPNYLPIVVGSEGESPGIRILNKENAFSQSEKKWENSIQGTVDAVGFFQGNELKFLITNSYAVIKGQKEGQFLFYNSYFRGGFSVYSGFPDGFSFFPINHLDLESYLYGVVPREMPTSWHTEALKAQAVCARTYALSSLNTFSNYDYDVAPTIVSQVYGGVSAENPSGTQAVDSTRGEEMFYGNERVQAFFHSSNGGFCAGSEDVFTTKLPYFRPKPDPYSLKITTPWTVQVSPEIVKQGLSYRGIHIGDIVNLEIVDVNPSRIVRTVRVYGTQGNTDISGDALRAILGGNNVKSLYFKLVNSVDEGSEMYPLDSSSSSSQLPVLTQEGIKKVNRESLSVIKEDGSLVPLNTDTVLSANGREKIAFEQTKSEGEAYGGAKIGDTGMVILGYGWGHNLGMSQWGAKVMADEGFSYRDILNFYYEGMEIRKN